MERCPETGNAIIRPPSPGDVPTPERLFRRCCYFNGIAEPEKVARLWAAEQERRKA